MRRFSQRNPLVTLSDINITPLLDLAFVLLIIFIITTPLLEQSMNLKLPRGGTMQTTRVDKNDIKTIEVSPQGTYRTAGKQVLLKQLESDLIASFRANTNLVVRIRADENGIYKHVAAVIDVCQKHNITRISLSTELDDRK